MNMKTTIFTLLMIVSVIVVKAQNNRAIFLHHSTGGAVYSEGGVEQWITDYNSANGTNFSVTEFAYPNDPWGWENYPYDFWKLWVDGSCDNSQANIQCLDQLCQNYELVIFKHCFPGAAISDDSGIGDVSSSEKTLNNYKLQYRALLNKFDKYPNNKFMVWTLAPLHRNATYAAQAQLAGQFVDWVKNTWLTEDGKSHSNVLVFDFFGYAAEQSENPEQGFQYSLKYNYEGDHNGDDSHPNTAANQAIGPLFSQAIVNALFNATSIQSNKGLQPILHLFYDASTKSIIYQINNQNERCSYQVEVFSMLGQKIKVFETNENTGSIFINEQKGVFIVRFKIDKTFVSRKVVF